MIYHGTDLQRKVNLERMLMEKTFETFKHLRLVLIVSSRNSFSLQT